MACSYAFGSEHGEGEGIAAWGGIHPWTLVTADLSSYLVAGTASVKIRFAFASDPAYSTAEQPEMFGAMVDDIAFGTYANNGVLDGQMSWSSLVPTAGDFWHLATDAGAPSPTHIMSSMNSAGTYAINMLNYLESPEIVLPTGATQISADFQLKGSYADSGVFPDVDYFGWEIYHTGAWHYMSNPYDDPDGMNYVYSGCPDTWASMIASYTLDGDLTDLEGQTVKFRWYFQSNDNTPVGTPLQIDDFQIFSVSAAPAPPNLVYPTNGQEDLPYTGFIFDWAVSSLGAFPGYYTIGIDADDANLAPGDFFAPSYSLEIVPVYNPADSLYYLSSSCNSNNIPDFTMAAGQTWYWTVVASITDQPNAYSEIWRFDTVSAAEVITTFPWNEGFEGATFPPANWTEADIDADTGGINWDVWYATDGATYVHGGTQSAFHDYSAEVPDPGQNGWLITPPVQIPATGTSVFSFWNYCYIPAWMVYNGVKINSNNDPTDPGWVELWSQNATANAWAKVSLNLNAYAGQIVYLAFNYKGYDADTWFVDDVDVTNYLVDTMPPTLTHLPIISTPREDLSYPLSANIVDDTIWNNPIGGANVYYSTDAGTSWSAAIPMTLGTAPTYHASIPAQALETTVTYKIEAWDSLNNMLTSANYSFMVADPVWVSHFGASGLFYSGYGSAFGPSVMFTNPFFGTSQAMQLSSVSGRGRSTFGGSIHVYSYDGSELVDLIAPIAITFNGSTQITDLSAYNIQITTPYFMVSYEGVGGGTNFIMSNLYKRGTSYVWLDGELYAYANDWLIRAYEATGAAIPAAPALTIINDGGSPTLNWASDPTANHYMVYGANDPYGAWTLLGSPITNSYVYTGVEDMKFFKVYADSEALPTRGTRTFTSRNINTSALPLATGGIVQKE